MATGIGKTRLMGASIYYLYKTKGYRHFFILAPGSTIYDKLRKESNPAHPKYIFKGLEADNVILNVSKWCFPLIHRDWVYNRILGASIDSITDEEHRLLYVGLTRARKRLYLLSVSPDETSPFIDGSSIEKISERLDSSKVNDYSAPDGTVFVLVSGKTYPHVDDFHQWRFRFEPSMKSWLRTFPDRQSFDDFRKESPWLRNPRITVLTADSMQKIQELYSSSQKKRR